MQVRRKRSVKDKKRKRSVKDKNPIDISDFLANFAQDDPSKYRYKALKSNEFSLPESKNPDVKKLLSEFDLNSKNFEEMKNLMDRIIAIEPQNSDAWFNKGLVMDRQAEAWYRNGVEITDVHVKELIKCYLNALKHRPKMAMAWLNLGITYQNSDGLKQAKDCFMTTIDLTPDSDPVHICAMFNLINMSFDIVVDSDIEVKITETFTKAQKSSNPNIWVLGFLGMGTVLAKSSKYPEAVECWDQGMLKINPSLQKQNPSPEDKILIGMWFILANYKGKALESSEQTKAIQWYQTLCKITPKWPLPYFRLAEIQKPDFRTGKWESISEQSFVEITGYYDDAIRIFKYQNFWNREKLSEYNLGHSFLTLDELTLAEVLHAKGVFLIMTTATSTHLGDLNTTERFSLGTSLLDESFLIHATPAILIFKCFTNYVSINLSSNPRHQADRFLESRRCLEQAIALGLPRPEAKKVWDDFIEKVEPIFTSDPVQKYLKDYELSL